jgi:hypothetical protein
MKRRLLNLLAALSLLLCVAVGVLWVRSYFVPDRVRWGEAMFHPDAADRLKGADVFSSRGVAGIYFITPRRPKPTGGRLHYLFTTFEDSPPAPPPPGFTWERDWKGPSPKDATTVSERLGFRLDREPASFTSDGSWGIEFPLWLLILVFAVPPGLYLYNRRCRYPAGRCARCGYDLRATPGRCPECGQAAAGGVG